MKKLLITLFFLLNFSLYASNFDSRYTSLKEENCKLKELIEEGGRSISICPGFGDFKVEIYDVDLRQSVFLIRNGREYPLNLWTSNFSQLGSLIEWRYKKGNARKVVGVIARLNVNDYPNDLNKTTSYLIVMKVMQGEICLVGKIRPQANQNVIARRMAEKSVNLPCIQ